MSVACDDGSFSSPKSSHEGVAFPLRPANTFPNEVRSVNNQIFLLRATLVTPPPLRGTPSINRGGFCKALTISIVGISLISNSRSYYNNNEIDIGQKRILLPDML